ncbi:hypothetical protein BMMON2_21580 [Burkholderia mallei]
MPDKHNHRVDAEGLSLGSLRTAAWLRYLLDHAERFAAAAASSREARVAAADVGLLLNELLAALEGDGASVDEARGNAYGELARTPPKRLLAAVDRYLPGSKAVFDGAHGVADVLGYDDAELGWAALDSIELGIGRALASDGKAADDAMRGIAAFEGPAAGG